MGSETYCRKSDWEKTRELYTDWVADWGEKSTIKRVLLWRGFSLWWCCNLVHKDADVNKVWFENLHNRLSGIQKQIVLKTSLINKCSKFIKLFIIDLLKWLFVKTLLPFKESPSGLIWFHSLSSNLKIEKDQVSDRMFSTAHLKDKDHGFVSAYLIFLNLKKEDFFNLFSFKKNTRKMLIPIQRETVVLNSFVRLSDVLSIHFSTFVKWIKFRALSRNTSFRSDFRIDGILCDDILIDELERSFLGPFQWSLVYATAFKRWLETLNEPQVIVTYGETLAEMRPVYHFAKRVNKENCFVSIQHSVNSRNKLGLYHRKSEFSQQGDWDGVEHSPMPDYYLVQGNQFADILGKFYPPERISIIGSLKYDQYPDVLMHKHKYEKECRSIVGYDTSKLLLLAPSVNDFVDILEFFQDVVIPTGWRVVVSPHPAVSVESIKGLISEMCITLPMDFYPELPTFKLLTIVDLVVCGYSAVVFEAAIFGVKSVRIANNSTFPLLEDEPEIPFFTRKEDFWTWFIEQFQANGFDDNRSTASTELTMKYFYTIDGKSADRLWQSITKINNLRNRRPKDRV